MARPKNRVPKLYHHKASGQGYVRIDGQDRYLGRHGSTECEQNYRALVAELTTTGDVPDPPARNDAPAVPLSINELILAYHRHAEGYYQKNGEPTSELRMIRDALRRRPAALRVDRCGRLRAEETEVRPAGHDRQGMVPDGNQQEEPRRNRITPRVIKQTMSKWKKKRPEHFHPPPLQKTFAESAVVAN